MSNGPLPSKLAPLSSLASHQYGEKVRFLGWFVSPLPVLRNVCSPSLVVMLATGASLTHNSPCSVTSYTIASAQLTLQHNFPHASGVKALVDVRLLLEKLTAEQTSIGQWVNVIGYIASPSPAPVKQQSKREMGVPSVQIQALVLWSAGPLDIGRYERCLAGVAERDEPEAKRQKSKTT